MEMEIRGGGRRKREGEGKERERGRGRGVFTRAVEKLIKCIFNLSKKRI
jgi:hypothetical protein